MTKDRFLTDDERILWGKVARTTRAMPGRKAELDELEMLFQQATEMLTTRPAKPAPEQKSAEIVLTAPAKPKIHHPLERPVKRKLSKGHLALEARIDLHGMIQSEAHGLLLHFVMSAHQRGLRHVLVITGKGTSLGSDGALKRAVPLWFSLPEFRPLISSYEPAARNHGGDGALYVRLERSRGPEL
ncbi:Smr/MutS family protein [Rhizobium sp. CFBP 8762]|uniref:Smr/MutS family protein n=1 Tax=Rhizobium sp. CFBP 8762 TaxID=2775279 RepID=UPI00178237E8|nr:Smr/MutS family protein [Rhizobium sp. CFBP 8762]MBD8556766.1 Smr/MutS family protein [Rhizobium sp. CFBP 8762]